MKTFFLITLMSLPCLADNMYRPDFAADEQGAILRNAMDDANANTTRAIENAASSNARAVSNAAALQAQAMDRQTEALDFYALSSGGLSPSQIIPILKDAMDTQKRRDDAQWSQIVDQGDKPLYVTSPDGKYKIGPVYVKAGTTWQVKP